MSVIGAATTVSAHTKPSPPSITTVPIQVVQTADGAVGYRSDGTGPPLVMIMGFGGSQDEWPPALVNVLAVNHRVIIFDNAGIGQTSMPSGTLTISAMADQTAALIEALGLGQPAVLGWSMGGMIAQALAVLHPGDVGRLVLSATVAGDGTAIVPSTAIVNQLVDAVMTGNTSELMPLLFPPIRWGPRARRSSPRSFRTRACTFPRPRWTRTRSPPPRTGGAEPIRPGMA